METERSGDGALRYSVDATEKVGRRRAKIRVGDIAHNIVQLGVAAADHPAPPKHLELEVEPSGAVRVRWKDKARRERGYMLARGDEVFVLAAGREGYLDTGAVPGVSNCYTLQSFNDAGMSGPVKACVTTPTARGIAAARVFGTVSLPRPRYVTVPGQRLLVDAQAGSPPELPVARIYKAYEPWGQPGVEEALEARGYVRGQSLFVHPVEDLTAGIPAGTVMVWIPSASHGDRHDQVSAVNAALARRALMRFVRAGGALVQHAWSEGKPGYDRPGGAKPVRRLVVHSEDVVHIGVHF